MSRLPQAQALAASSKPEPTMQNILPHLPPPLCGTDKGTFTEQTIRGRFPDTVAALLTDNAFSPKIQTRIRALLAELPNGRLSPLLPDGGQDHAFWEPLMQPHYGKTWLTAPWLEVEYYLYRRILEATEYFSLGDGFGVDPFKRKKQQGLRDTAGQTEALAQQLDSEADLGTLIQVALWGNQADLSLWQAGDDNNPTHSSTASQKAHTLADDTTAVLTHLQQATLPTHVQFINDNAGFELITDFALADGLLKNEIETVTFNLKTHPTFVSDATVADAHQTIDFLLAQAGEATQAFGKRLQRWCKNGRLLFTTHPAWTLPLPFWALPADLQARLGHATLLISKGDANYRRLLGDRHWPFDTPFADIVNYPPAPLLALRTLKSEVASGISSECISQLNKKESGWLTNGKWGLVQFSMGKKEGK